MGKKKKPTRREPTPSAKESAAKVAGGDKPDGGQAEPRPSKSKQTSAPPQAVVADESTRFPIVGVGASAGGLDALKHLFGAMPEEPGLAFVVVQHLDPTKQSLTPELLDKHTAMQVTQVEDDPRVLPNRVYVIPPNKYLSISQGALHLSPPEEPRGSRMAIDYFLRSLAQDQQQRAVAIVLSGTGTDGSLGVKAVKAQGGLVIAQDADTAAHPGMPRSAVATGTVDYVLAPEAMADRLIRFAQHPYVRESASDDYEEDGQPDEERSTEANASHGENDRQRPEDLSSILALLKARTGLDFNSYKDKTLIRRTRRRMCLHHQNEYSEYLSLLRGKSEEVDALVKDLLITVTDFFRDLDAWNQIEQQVVPQIVSGKEQGEPIRVWTPGCATGEEPYSLAILLMEALALAEKECPLQIFASDVERDVLHFARRGRYPKSIEADVSRGRLKRFFTPAEDDGHHYFVSKAVREAVVFAEQNLISDPPFSNLDLICCRNLLIYIKPEIQEKIITLFHYALVQGGFLFLGNSETIGRHGDLFETIDKRWRIFRSIGKTRHEQVQVPIVRGAGARRSVETRPEAQRQTETRITQRAQQILLDLLSPSAVVVDAQWRIQYILGEVDDYLTHAAGVPNDNLLEKCRRGLRSKMRGGVKKALDEQRTVSVLARVQRDGKYHDVRLIVRPFQGRDEEQPLALVIFEQSAAEVGQPNDGMTSSKRAEATDRTSPQDGEPLETDIDADSVIRQLEDELSATKEDLQHTIEQGETSQEELKAANEEVMSINEELQSTNEELETSKEELESLNEELSTVNHQLAGKVEELETKHADLENLIAATDVATICLDTEHRIRWFTPTAMRLFRISSTDNGRPISDFAHDFPDGDLQDVAQQVFDKLTPIESEVGASEGRFFLRRVTPYRGDEHRIRGVVITFVEITTRKRWEEKLKEAKRLSDTIIDSVLMPILALDGSLRVKRANDAFYDRFQVSPAETEGQLVYELGNRQWDIPKLRELLESVLPEREAFNGLEVEHEFETIGRRTMLLNARRLDSEKLILLAIEDVTELRAEAAALRESEERLRMAAEAAQFGSYSFDYQRDQLHWSPELYEICGLDPGEPINQARIIELIHPEDRQRFRAHVEQAITSSGDEGYAGEFRIVRADESVRWIVDRGKILFADAESPRRPVRAVGMVVDITAQKEAEQAIATVNESLEQQVRERMLTLSIVQDVAIAANEAQSIEEAFRFALQRICDYNHWVLGHVYRRDADDSNTIVSAGIWHTNAERVKDADQRQQFNEFQRICAETHFVPEQAVIGHVFETGEPEWVDDVTKTQKWAREDPRRQAAEQRGLHASIAFPIKADGQVVKVFECFSDRPINREARFMEIMHNVGIQLGHVVERTNLERQVAEAVVEEQRRLGSDIHDGIGQELSGLRLLAQTHTESLAEKSLPDQEIAKRITTGLGTIQRHLRRIIRDLIPVEVDGKGLAAALQALAERINETQQVKCLFEEPTKISIEDKVSHRK